MKEHAIIPIFIPHNGCPHDCVFCNQRRITARQKTPTAVEIEEIVERNLSTIEEQGIQNVEIAYFGGSFTGIPIEEQNRLLAPAIRYKEDGRILRIRLSTRPDYISPEIIGNLRANSVDAVELGAQSFDNEVLRISARGHTAECTADALTALNAAGFETALQLMSGLPGSSSAKDIASAITATSLAPTSARIYPTVILKDTALHDMFLSGEYTPPSQAEMIQTVKEMYLILKNAGIKILRVGLKSTDLIAGESDSVEGSYHPAFRQLVEGNIARDIIEKEIQNLHISSAQADSQISPESESKDLSKNLTRTITIIANPANISDAAGHNGENRKYFAEKFPNISLKFISDNDVNRGEYTVKLDYQ